MAAAATLFPLRRAFAAAFVVVVAASGCATGPQLGAQWTDPQLGPKSAFLRGGKVLVACDVADLTMRQICQDRLASEMSARGVTPVVPGPQTQIATDRSIDAQLVSAARDAGAKAMMVLTLTPGLTQVSQGVQIGIGGFGYGSGGGGVGVGMSAPVGGGQVTQGYVANGRITDVASGRLVWSVSASTPPSSDVPLQFDGLSKTVFGAADQSGLF